ncbi:hypothetical protein AArcCO_4148 (plasmid) [Halalkaliarchaeum sp. AArc-CO]|nr:hypothetical protein AArcCO_4148 [Halalkaliarchaeum sp. AArc-CO]
MRSQVNLIPLDLPRLRLVGINTRTLGASVRVGGSTPPDSTRRTTPKTRVLRGAAFPSSKRPLHIEVFNILRGRYQPIRSIV